MSFYRQRVQDRVEAVGPLQQGLRLGVVNPQMLYCNPVEAVGPLQQGLRLRLYRLRSAGRGLSKQ